MKQLSTARTRMRPFTLEDAPAAFEWFSDPDVMRFIPSAPDASVQQTEQRIARYLEHEKLHGYSKWLVLDAESGEPLGDSGFFTLPGTDRPELGYRLRREEWGRGLATEISAAWLAVAPSWYGFLEVYAFAHPENRASLHVMEKLGFVFSHTEEIYGASAPLYRLDLRQGMVSGEGVAQPLTATAMPSRAQLIASDQGTVFNLLGNPTTVKITGADTGGSYVLYEQVLTPEAGVPPHVHTREDEVFFVLEGQVEFLAGDRVVLAGPGDVVHAPRDVPHAYKGAGTGPSRLRFMAMPADIEGMFAQLASWPSDEAPDMGKLAELCGKYGISFA